jgi:hypothetical protein
LSRGNLTDEQWRIFDPLLPDRGERGPAIESKRCERFWTLPSAQRPAPLPAGVLCGNQSGRSRLSTAVRCARGNRRLRFADRRHHRPEGITDRETLCAAA